MAQVNVTVLGLQRIGGSVGLAFKKASTSADTKNEFVITGYDESRDAMKAAHTMGAIDHEVRDPAAAVQRADIVFVAVPYGMVKDLFYLIGPELKSGAVVFDLSPLKMPSIEWASQSFKPEAYLVGISPVINPDLLYDGRTGIVAARADMFERGGFIISPSASCPEEAVQLASEVAGVLGLKVHFTDPLEHDAMVAPMETLPLLLHMALFRSVSSTPGWGDLQRLGNLPFALGTYRLGVDTPEDIAAAIDGSKQNTLRALDALSASIAEIASLIRTSDAATVAEAYGSAVDSYHKWYRSRLLNKWAESENNLMPANPGVLGPLTGRLFRRNENKK